jgi:hypothetical protein
VGVLFYCAGEHHLYVLLIVQEGSVQSFQLMDWPTAFPLIDDLLDGLRQNRSLAASRGHRLRVPAMPSPSVVKMKFTRSRCYRPLQMLTQIVIPVAIF